MTHTHPSHFDLTSAGQNETSIFFTGPMYACKRMAFAHGMEVEKYEGSSLGSNGCAIATPDKFARCWFKDGGMIQRLPDNLYWLSIPIEVWNREV